MIVDGFEIGCENSVYLIAEMSANHNGRIENALKTIEAAKQSGANAIKLQTYTPDTLTMKANRPEFYLNGGLWDGRHLYDLYEEAHTPFEWHETLFEYASKCGITIFSTPFDDTAVDLLESLKTPAYKIASFELIDIPLIKRVAKTKKPLFMSTGAASMNEISEALRIARKYGSEEILLFHCISSYPAPIEESQLENIKILKEKYGVLVGLSDHTIGSDAGFLSVAMGADAIEKHFIFDRSIGGADSEFSATPEEFRYLRNKIDIAKKMIGSHEFSRAASEKQSTNIRRSIYFCKDKKLGDYISADDIKIIRPGSGMQPKYYDQIIGKTLSASVKFGDPVEHQFFNEVLEDPYKKYSDFKLIEVEKTKDHISRLYLLLKSRKYGISHERLPKFEEHEEFVINHPYRFWALIIASDDSKITLGSVYITKENSVGLNINFGKISFSADYFLNHLKSKVAPNPAQKSVVYKDFYFNVSADDLEYLNWLSASQFCETQRSFVSVR